MLRDSFRPSIRPRTVSRIALVLALGAALSGCGVKGPLRLPPPSAAAAGGTSAPAPAERATEPARVP